MCACVCACVCVREREKGVGVKRQTTLCTNRGFSQPDLHLNNFGIFLNIILHHSLSFLCVCFVSFSNPTCKDSGNYFRGPKIGSDNSCSSFILFLYPHVVPSRFSKRQSFLELTRTD